LFVGLNLPALKLLASVIFATIFCGIFVVLYNTYHTQSAEAKFGREADQLAGLIRTLKDEDPGSTTLFTIEVPQDCWLKFENTFVAISIGGENKSFNTFVSLSGPSFSDERVELTLRRTSEEVELSG
jgi:hypothetical protein